MLEENDDLKQRLAEFSSQKQSQESQKEYLEKVAELQAMVKELQSQNSEYKAKEIIKVFNGSAEGIDGSDASVGGLLGGLGSLTNITSDSAEVAKLKSQLSSKTNEILQLREDKEILEQQIETLLHQSKQEKQPPQTSSFSFLNEPRVETVDSVELSHQESKNSIVDSDTHDSLLHQLDQVRQTLAEKESDLEKLQGRNKELEGKVQKLNGEFTTVRAKA